jgi:hypothetical protein
VDAVIDANAQAQLSCTLCEMRHGQALMAIGHADMGID